jgi:hypothetical protein
MVALEAWPAVPPCRLAVGGVGFSGSKWHYGFVVPMATRSAGSAWRA